MDIGMCDCGKWGECPKTFNETKHFLQCPSCKKPMYLTRMVQPNELGLRELNKVEITRIVKDCYNYLRYVSRWDKKELDMSGYRGKTSGEAMLLAFKSYEARMEKLFEAHLKKYPD